MAKLLCVDLMQVWPSVCRGARTWRRLVALERLTLWEDWCVSRHGDGAARWENPCPIERERSLLIGLLAARGGHWC